MVEIISRLNPEKFADNAPLRAIYERGLNHGHGFACHNVPEIGKTYWTEASGKIKADEENIREVHSDLCFAAESNSRQYSPFEFTAHEFNSLGDEAEISTDEAWQAFDEGYHDAIMHDLSGYTDEDYGIEPEEEESEDEDE